MDYQCFYLNLQCHHSYNFIHHKSPISYQFVIIQNYTQHPTKAYTIVETKH